jgi:predicted alpha/beta-hydrolase family hydrolase
LKEFVGMAGGNATSEDVLDLETPHGPARAHLHTVSNPRAALVLGHGAGGGVAAPDLVAATEAASAADVSVALIEQPYRVAGRRSAAPARQLDAAWIAVIEGLRGGPLADISLITGGRSSGARVACRTAADTGAAAVLCLAFPLVPPKRRNATEPPQSRIGELESVEVPVLIVQGERDRFGMPPAGDNREVAVVAGDHALRADAAAVRGAVGEWLARVAG